MDQGSIEQPCAENSHRRISVADSRIARTVAGIGGQRLQSAMGRHNRAVADIIAKWSALAVAGQRNHDQVGFYGAQAMVSNAKPIDDPRRKILRGDIAMARQFMHQRDALRLLQIDLDAQLVVILLVETAAAVESRLAVGLRNEQAADAGMARAFDPNHFRPKAGELRGAERSRPHPAEIE